MKKQWSYYYSPDTRPLDSRTVTECFRETARRYPYKEAIIFRGVRDEERSAITFREWFNASGKLASFLIESGLKSGDRVGVLLSTCIEFATVQYGLFRAGIVPVLLAPSTGTDTEFYDNIERFDLKGMVLNVDDSKYTKNILSALRKCLKQFKSRSEKTAPHLDFIVTVSDQTFEGTHDLKTLLERSSVDETLLTEREKEFDFESTALVYMSSGTTGAPKGIRQDPTMYDNDGFWQKLNKRYLLYLIDNIIGIEKSHLNLLHIVLRFFGITSSDVRYFTDRPLNLGGSLVMIFAATVGCTSVITPSTARYSLEKRTERLLRLWNEEKITDANILPYQVYDIVKYHENHPVHFESMKSVLWGSDAMDQDQLRLALEVIPGLTAGYGSMEVLVCMQSAEMSKEERMGNVGKPIPGIEVKVADENGKVVALGVPGEICVRSFRTAELSYIGQNVKEAMFEGGWYRMGDIGTMDDRGHMKVIGRSKDIIKHSGIAINPAAVGAVIKRHPMVSRVEVVGVPREEVGEEVCACVILNEGCHIEEEELQQFANEAFVKDESSYSYGIRPDHVLIMAAFPLTVVGKCDRRKIRALAIERVNQTPV